MGATGMTNKSEVVCELRVARRRRVNRPRYNIRLVELGYPALPVSPPTHSVLFAEEAKGHAAPI